MTLPALIPMDLLFGNPDKASAKLSPDGTKLAFLAPDEGVLNVWVGTVDGSDFRPVTNDRRRGIQAYGWAYDGRHLLYAQDQGGDENWRLYTVDLDSGDVVDRTPFDGVQATIIQASPDHPDEILVGLNRDDPRYHDVYRLTLSTGELVKEISNPGYAGWLVDRSLTVRGALQPTDDGGERYLLREGDDWNVAVEVASDDYLINVTHALGFSADGRRLFFVSAANADTARLVALDTQTMETTVLAADPKYDIFTVEWLLYGDATLHPKTYEPRLAPIFRDRFSYEVLDTDIAEDLATVTSTLDGDVHIVSRDVDDRIWLIIEHRDRGPSKYYTYERSARTLSFLFATKPGFENYELAANEPITFTARDGLEVHGYVTFPPGVGRKDLPCVLHVHGGPWGGRHMWGMDSMNQWIANRGYVCLEIDFRGSGGYGKNFMNASARQWSRAMHDDLLDGIDHCVKQGWIDRDRVGIFGISYGGYAALVGATFTPDVFTCAVDCVGPSNLITLLESIPPYWFSVAKQFDKLLGNPERDRDELWACSPLSRVADITIPVFIAQGANDPRVKQAESEQIVAAMKDRGIPHTYQLFEDEGHYFVQPENRKAFHLAAERFMAQHLGGRAE
ncbi:MAG: S9 family peptidase [Actinomycetota bacterium]